MRESYCGTNMTNNQIKLTWTRESCTLILSSSIVALFGLIHKLLKLSKIVKLKKMLIKQNYIRSVPQAI